MAAAVAAGIPVTVVPGVSSATAFPGAAGIPVTHRGTGHLFTVVSGHAPLTTREYRHLAGLGGTIVVLLGVVTLPSLVAGLLQAGLSIVTPVAVVERGFSHEQRTVTFTLGSIVNASATCTNPAVIVIGDVVALAPHLTGMDIPEFFLDASLQSA